ncbi:hypothetical protein NIES39_J01300 [Arthrospira platensis NIES-39]|nr:hypothetical protein NIES39_J01300 [Arthrospira platensis NIES-39]
MSGIASTTKIWLRDAADNSELIVPPKFQLILSSVSIIKSNYTGGVSPWDWASAINANTLGEKTPRAIALFQKPW